MSRKLSIDTKAIDIICLVSIVLKKEPEGFCLGNINDPENTLDQAVTWDNFTNDNESIFEIVYYHNRNRVDISFESDIMLHDLREQELVFWTIVGIFVTKDVVVNYVS